MKGEEARKSFYNDKGASILEGYKILTGGVRLRHLIVQILPS